MNSGFPLRSLTRSHVLTCALLFAFACSFEVRAQDGALHVVKLNEAYTWLTSTPATLDSIYLGLDPTSSSSHRTFIRISFPGQVIDLISDNDSAFWGTLTQETTEYRSIKTEWGDDSQPFQRLYQKEPLDTMRWST